MIQEGVCPDWPCPELVVRGIPRQVADQKAALEVLEEYMQEGPVCEIPLHKQGEAKFLVPWFVLKKVDSSAEKNRGP